MMEQKVMLPVLIIIFSICLWLEGCSAEFTNNDYLIRTSKCTIPNLPLWSPTLNFTRNPGIPCSNYKSLLSYTSVQNGIPRLHIREDLIIKYYGTLNSIRCCYSYVYRNGTESLPDVGIMVSNCIDFSSAVDLQHDLVWIACDWSNNPKSSLFRGFPIIPIYENIHQVITVSSSIKERVKKLKESTPRRPISVLMVVIDSMSRLNFIRTMPFTKDFVVNNNFYEFKGYNKIDDNTFPNAMAFLAGLNLRDAEKICQPTEINGLVNCPLIWYKYRNLGYATAYAEDWSEIATFNFYKKGFKYNPTDYYFKPYMDAITYLKREWQDTMPFCAGPESQGDRILNLALDFVTKMKGIPNFGIFWMNTFSHNEITSPLTMDHKVRMFFDQLKASQIIDESVVILLSDHGIRFGDIVNTGRGYYELRLPMNYISLPNWFKQEYPSETKNLEGNANKLTSNYDLYMTLQHILTLSGANHTITPSPACQHCRSFFENIPEERSCWEAGIPMKWCTCDLNITDLNGNYTHVIHTF